MKTLEEATKCLPKKAKIRRKLGEFFGHLRQSEVHFAENCDFRASSVGFLVGLETFTGTRASYLVCLILYPALRTFFPFPTDFGL